MSESKTKKLLLSSTFDELDRLEPFVLELQEWAKFSDSDFDRIMLALSEAVNNAIIHGNQRDPNKKVQIEIQHKVANSMLVISVEDEGEGFNPDDVPDPLKEENLLNEGGRGIYLMEQYCEDVKFSKKGTRITIIFHLEE